MGISIAGQIAKGHHTGVQRGFCAEYHQEGQSLDMRAVESGSEGQDATHRLPETGGQGVATRPSHGDPVQGNPAREHGRGTVGEEPRMYKARVVRESLSYKRVSARVGFVFGKFY